MKTKKFRPVPLRTSTQIMARCRRAFRASPESAALLLANPDARWLVWGDDGDGSLSASSITVAGHRLVTMSIRRSPAGVGFRFDEIAVHHMDPSVFGDFLLWPLLGLPYRDSVVSHYGPSVFLPALPGEKPGRR